MRLSVIAILVLTGGCTHNPSPDYVKTLDRERLFTQYNPNFKAEHKALREEFERLKKVMFEKQRTGTNVTCSRQIGEEANALLNNSADLSRARKRIEALKEALENPRNQSFAEKQSKEDGSWGACYEGWNWKVVETIERARDLDNEGKVPKYPVTLLDPINSPEKLTAYLDSVLISDIAKDGINHRRELNEVGTALIRAIRKRIPRNYPWHPKLWDTFVQYLDQKWQNPETGYWGAWYRMGDEIIKTDDLSITFHIVSYRNGKVHRWNKIAGTTLAIKERPYPFGWRPRSGGMSNHHNYDVVRLLRLGWTYLSLSQKKRAGEEIDEMVAWGLSESLQADGSFLYNTSDDSLGDSYYFGVSILDEAGYFDPSKRFWTSQEFPESEAVRSKIVASLRKIAYQDLMMKSALEKLR